MRALVTGSAGFIGRHISAQLEADGYIVDRCDPQHASYGVQANGGYVSDLDCRRLFRTNVAPYDLVVHCAATVGGREGIDFNAAMLAANNLSLDGSMFEWALHMRPGRIVYFSSAAAYPTALQTDEHQGERLAESAIRFDTFGMPDETYGWAKLTGEITAQRVRAAGVPVTVVRPFSSYDYDQDDCYPFPEFVHRAARHDDPFVVWGDGTQTRDLIHVNDLVNAIIALVDNQVDGPVNLGTGRATSMDELARIAMNAAGYSAPIDHLLDKPVGVKHRVSDNTQLLEYYTPQITVEDGVERALAAVNGQAKTAA